MSANEFPSRMDGRKGRRRGISLDMTPLVDVAFLLLTFFIFSTTMTQPHVMELSVPSGLTYVAVPVRRTVTFFVRGDGRLFYSGGIDPPDHR